MTEPVLLAVAGAGLIGQAHIKRILDGATPVTVGVPLEARREAAPLLHGLGAHTLQAAFAVARAADAGEVIRLF